MKQIFIYLTVTCCLMLSGCRSGLSPSEILTEADKLSDSIPSKALIKLEEIKNVKNLSVPERAEYNFIFSKSMLRSGNKLASDSIINEVIRYYLNRNDSAMLHQSIYYKGLYHFRNAKHDSAAIYFDKAAEAIPIGKDYIRKSNYKRMAGFSYLYLGEKEQAIKTQKEALQYARSTNDSLPVIYSLLNLADAYNSNKETEHALETYLLALHWVREMNYREMEANILNIISGIYESDNKIMEALSHKNKAQEVKRNRRDIPAANLYRAILFSKQNRADSARYYAQMSLKGDDQYVADLAYTFLSISEEREGRIIDALNISKNSERIFDSFLTGIRSSEIQQKYEKEKLENENNQLKIKQKEHQFYLLMCVFLLLLMLIVIYLVRLNSKRKNEKIASENQMLRLQQENLLLKQQQEISILREKEAVLRESLFKKINFFNKLPSLQREENNHNDKQGKIKITHDDWLELISGIQDAYPGFLHKIKQHATSLTEDDVCFCCLLKINVNMQDLSDIYCVSKAAITKRKYRLKTEKFHIADNSIPLDTFLQQF